MSLRHTSGSKVRVDGGGDGWAGQHRTELGRGNFMQDLDVFAGTLSFATNGQDRVFAEYAPDSYVNARDTVRDFALVALFDRKSTRSAAMSNGNRLSLGFYLSVCRTYAAKQPTFPPHFYFVCGKSQPWEMIKIDIDTGDELETYNYSERDWKQVWAESGLKAGRGILSEWIK